MKNLTLQSSHLARLALFAGCALLFTGCATSKLWDSTKAHYYQPFTAVPPEVLHDPATDAFLVICPQYCHTGTHDSHHRRVGYWFYPAGGARQAAGKTGLERLTVYVRCSPGSGSPKPEPFHGVYHPEEQLLLIHRPDGTTNSIALASVHVKADPVGKILLTPFGVAADTVMVGGATAGVVSVGAAEAMAYRYAPYHALPCPNAKATGTATGALIQQIVSSK